MKKWCFIIGMLCRGENLMSAKWRWHLRCLEKATIGAFGSGMGNYKIVTRDGVIFPNQKN